ncbi:hypothetical protein FH972_021561 [Carpinus fangiana]|uniref:Uncharacterized protein n=1 Tax=Carpinus fangiana TaxID=176857 RepID=A0A5N6KQ93_9ROSI|nr:hypothetical protein FH972_021561 [Carpinus fangiana]
MHPNHQSHSQPSTLNPYRPHQQNPHDFPKTSPFPHPALFAATCTASATLNHLVSLPDECSTLHEAHRASPLAFTVFARDRDARGAWRPLSTSSGEQRGPLALQPYLRRAALVDVPPGAGQYNLPWRHGGQSATGRGHRRVYHAQQEEVSSGGGLLARCAMARARAARVHRDGVGDAVEGKEEQRGEDAQGASLDEAWEASLTEGMEAHGRYGEVALGREEDFAASIGRYREGMVARTRGGVVWNVQDLSTSPARDEDYEIDESEEPTPPAFDAGKNPGSIEAEFRGLEDLEMSECEGVEDTNNSADGDSGEDEDMGQVEDECDL